MYFHTPSTYGYTIPWYFESMNVAGYQGYPGMYVTEEVPGSMHHNLIT